MRPNPCTTCQLLLTQTTATQPPPLLQRRPPGVRRHRRSQGSRERVAVARTGPGAPRCMPESEGRSTRFAPVPPPPLPPLTSVLPLHISQMLGQLEVERGLALVHGPSRRPHVSAPERACDAQSRGCWPATWATDDEQSRASSAAVRRGRTSRPAAALARGESRHIVLGGSPCRAGWAGATSAPSATRQPRAELPLPLERAARAGQGQAPAPGLEAPQLPSARGHAGRWTWLPREGRSERRSLGA